MAPPAPITFHYGIGSRYSYLASTRIDRLRAETGREVAWRPFYSGDLFAARGADPFRGPPLSGQYQPAWRKRDAELWAALYGVPFREPEGVVMDPRRLAHACLAADRLGAVEPFSRRLFRAIFVEGRSPLDDPTLAALAAEVGLDGKSFTLLLDEPEVAAAHRARTAEAVAAGVFGVPSFVVEGEVIFGNDRLPLVRHLALGHSTARPGGD
jgi:2-hydroxychromene-2-carboxylate isomerase